MKKKVTSSFIQISTYKTIFLTKWPFDTKVEKWFYMNLWQNCISDKSDMVFVYIKHFCIFISQYSKTKLLSCRNFDMGDKGIYEPFNGCNANSGCHGSEYLQNTVQWLQCYIAGVRVINIYIIPYNGCNVTKRVSG